MLMTRSLFRSALRPVFAHRLRVIVAAAVRVVDGFVAEARVAIGGVSGVAWRSTGAEALLLGQSWTDDVLAAAAGAAADEIDPPTDVHGDAEFRRDLVRALLPRALQHAPPR